MLNPANLPDDIDALKAMLAASLAALADRDAVIERKEDRIVRLEKLLADFKRALFGARSERSDPERFELALEDIETAIAAIHAEDDAVDGRIEMDNNTVERTIRPIALNRKNVLLAGHDAGAANGATIASLVETCKLNAAEPRACLTQTLRAIVSGHKQSQIDDLLPWNYTAKV